MGQVQQDHQHPGALDVAEKAVPEASAGAGPFDQAGDVGHHELEVVESDHSQVRLQGGERIVGDLRSGGGDAGDEGALPRVREPHQRHVGHELELQVQPALLTDLGLFRERRSSPSVGQEASVAAAALTAPGGQPAVPFHDQIGYDVAPGITDHRPLGNRYLQVGAGLAMPPFAHSVTAPAGLAMGMVPEPVEGRGVAVGHQPDGAPVAPVPAVGAAFGHVRFPAKGDGPGPTVTRFDVDLGFVDER